MRGAAMISESKSIAMNPRIRETGPAAAAHGSVSQPTPLTLCRGDRPIAVLLAACLIWMTSATIVQAADRYVNGSCSVNGNGAAASCAATGGGIGAWNSLSAITTGGPGDVIHIRGGS